MKSTASEPGLDVVFLRPFFELQLRMNINKRETNKSFLKKFIWKTKCFCTQMKFALQFQRNVSATSLKFLIDEMKATQQSCLESERVS